MISDPGKKWLVLYNPHAGAGKGVRDFAAIKLLLEKYLREYYLIQTEYPRHAISLTKCLVEKGYKKILVAGGDGTLNEVVNGIFLQEIISPEDIVVGMLPIGTGNDWIKTFGIPVNYSEALEILLKEDTMNQTIGKVSYKNKTGEEQLRFFANIAGFGFDALVASNANKMKEKGRTGFFVYLYSLLSSYLEFRTSRTKIRINTREVEDYIFSCSAGIGKFSGGGMMQTPFAAPDKDTFQVTVIRKLGFLTILKNLRGLYSGKFVKDSHVSTHEATHLEIKSDSPIPGEVDGESLGNSSFTIELAAHKLKVIFGNDKYLEHKLVKKHNEGKDYTEVESIAGIECKIVNQ